jgi:uncharacterized protein YcfJ
MTTGGQQFWIVREAMPLQRSAIHVPSPLAGAVIDGILCYQSGGGTGQDTVGCAAAGAAIGAQVGQPSQGDRTTQDVQRCSVAVHRDPINC